MSKSLAFALLAPAIAGCGSVSSPDDDTIVYYLHGRIVEDQGVNARSTEYGHYDYQGIVEALDRPGIRVVSEVRPRDTNPSEYADEVIKDIRSQIDSGVHPSRIMVVGASKGGVIATLVSHRLAEPSVRYVLLGNCTPWLIRTFNPKISGKVLSIYEKSDELAGSCEELAARSPNLVRFSEIRLDTGLKHGFIYRPAREWVDPALDWATN